MEYYCKCPLNATFKQENKIIPHEHIVWSNNFAICEFSSKYGFEGWLWGCFLCVSSSSVDMN